MVIAVHIGYPPVFSIILTLFPDFIRNSGYPRREKEEII